jgi:glc operon protein GlcG
MRFMRKKDLATLRKEKKMAVRMRYVCCAVVLLGLLVCDAAPAPMLATKKVLTLEVAKQIAAASGQFAKKNQWNVVTAIVDDGGHLLYFERMDDVQTGSIEVAIQKAKTAAAFKRPSRLFEEAVAEGRTALVRLPGGIPFEGGVPISVDGQVIGAIGISGVTAQQDGMIAQAGVDALSKILGR